MLNGQRWKARNDSARKVTPPPHPPPSPFFRVPPDLRDVCYGQDDREVSALHKKYADLEAFLQQLAAAESAGEEQGRPREL